MQEFILPANATFFSLQKYIQQFEIVKIEFGPNFNPPFHWAKFYDKTDKLILKTQLSEALRGNDEFYNRLIDNTIFEREYMICFNGHNGLHYLTMPGLLL
jgi:hypothetical protein